MSKTMLRFALHPGNIFSANDGDIHFISSRQLSLLYGVPLSECIVWDERRPETFQGRRQEDYIHLYPRSDGKYRRLDAPPA